MITNANNIKEQVTIKDVLAANGYAVDSRGKCPCPVHQGKEKNFSVKDGIGTCWSQCGGQHWDSVGLLMALDNKLTYPEALERLAEIGKISVEYSEGSNKTALIEQAKLEKTEKESLYEVTQHVWQLYKQFMPKYNLPLTELVYPRGFTAATINKFGLTYAGDKPVLQKALSDFITQLLKLGLVKKKDTYMYEPFVNRIIFPIHNEIGKICGFGGRKLATDDSPYPKYLNSDESLIYNKSNLLYGLFQARKVIAKSRVAFLTEGYIDVMTMHEFGFENTVAGCGTAFTFLQAKLLKRYADRVILLYDGDDAGKNAAEKAIEICLSVGLFTDLVLLPAGEDPDSFLRTGVDFEKYVTANCQDALKYYVLKEYKPNDIFAQNIALAKAANLIALVQDKNIADGYISQIYKKIGISRATLTDKIKEIKGVKLERQYGDYTIEQKLDIEQYGLFIENNRYYMCINTENLGVEASNFIINPLMLIIGAERSWRLVEVINDKKRRFIADIDSDAFVDIASLKKELERRGNYIYKGKPEWFTRIKAKIYNETQECYPIQTLGWHNAGFFVWGNGITANNVFQKINEFGIVEFGENKYFLPAFAKVKTGSDDEENTYEDEREFIYVEGPTISFQEWTRRMVEVHGANGMMGVAYYIASLYRDIIYSKFNYFPHLNLFGPPGAGKSFMAWSIGAMYGKAQTPFHLVQGTNVGFFRRLAKKRNAISWYDEYSNDVDFKRVEALKAAYDGVGHEKGDKENEHNVKRTKVKSACIISGQQQPTQDPALFKRCISLNFPRFEKDDERDARGRQLKDIEQKNRLGQITSMLQKFRPNIEADFSQNFDAIRAETSPAIAHDKTVEDRIVNNHLIPLTVFKILSQHLEFAFTYEDFKAWVINNILEQSAAINNQDEVSSWWRMFNYLVEMDSLKHDLDFIVQEVDELTLMTKGNKGSYKKTFTNKKTVLFLRFEKSYPLYLENHKRQYSKNGLPETSLKYYLKGFDSFIGEVKAKKFNGQTKYCWAFDMEDLGLNIPLTKLFLDQQDINPTKDTAEAVEAMKSAAQKDLPF